MSKHEFYVAYIRFCWHEGQGFDEYDVEAAYRDYRNTDSPGEWDYLHAFKMKEPT